ncbi:MAG: hypothetical protein SRB2_03218 [Desulfobacteraceae bacterium Eth-SRB2]|nr:MAG: hypothetical protein SRB2_03218 [Desulfobacteraceae bacterium Eth-SRB2]
MNLRHFNFKMFKSIFLICITILALSCNSGVVTAQSSWFQKAKDLVGGIEKSDSGQSALSVDSIAAGLKDALRVGSETVVTQLGKPDGFNADPAIHIPLPENFKTVRNALDKIGMSSMLDDLELQLNQAAEVATPKAKALFLESIKEMTLDDAMGIYKGPDDAATKYFQSKMSKPLTQTMNPIVENSLSQVGAVQTYNNLIGKYRSLPFVPDVKADLTNYVTERGMNGIFHYLAREEAAIRQNPAKRTTDLLKRVFGAR